MLEIMADPIPEGWHLLNYMELLRDGRTQEGAN